MARRLFELREVRRRDGRLAAGVQYLIWEDEAATVAADIAASSGGSPIPGSAVTISDIAGLGPSAARFYGPTDDQDILWLTCPADARLGVQEIEAKADPRLDALESAAPSAAVAVIREAPLNVQDPQFGALGRNAADDDTPAIQAALDLAAPAGRGEIYIPPGIYRFKPQVARSTDPDVISNQGHGLAITGNDITISGAGREVTVLQMRPFASISGSLETSYQTVLGKVWRGGGFFITGGSSAPDPRRNILIRDLSLEGGCLPTGDTTTPASPVTGDGLDITHKGVWLENGKFFENIRIEDCALYGFKGEIIFYGGNGAGLVAAERCLIHSTNGDCWSVSGQCVVRDNEMHTAAHAAVEDGQIGLPCWYERNYVHGCLDHGISLFYGVGSADQGAPVYIHNNLIRDCPENGISVQFVRNVEVRANRVVDCGRSAGFRGIVANTVAGKPNRNLRIIDNHVQANLADVHTGIGIFDSGGAGYQGLEVRDNLVELTEYGRSLGKSITTPFSLTATPTASDVIRGNRALRTAANATDGAHCAGRLLGSTSATDVVTLTPWARGQYRVSVYYRVITAATNVTVTMAWTDDGGAQSKTLLALTSKAAGSYSDLGPVMIDSAASSQIKVTVTAGTADQVYVTAAIDEVAAAGPLFSPANLAGLQLWLKADAITGLADGAAVATWEDSSDQNRDATQATSGNRPAYKTDILIGRPVVRFDGTDDFLATTSYTLAQPFTVLVVASTTSTVGPRNVHGGNGGNGQVLVHSGNYKLYSGTLAVMQAATTTVKVLAATFDGTSSILRVNGPASSVTADAGTNGISGGSIIGKNDVGGNERWSGDIAELLVFKPVPSGADLLRLEQYLGAKYGVTIT